MTFYIILNFYKLIRNMFSYMFQLSFVTDNWIEHCISQQNFVDQILVSKSSINEFRFFFYTFIQIITFILSLVCDTRNKKNIHIFKKSISKSYIRFQNRHRDSTFESFLTFENSSEFYLIFYEINICFLFRW